MKTKQKVVMITVFLTALFLFSINYKFINDDSNVKDNNFISTNKNDIYTLVNNNPSDYGSNDLVYREYDSGIIAKKDSKLRINYKVVEDYENIAAIYIVNHENENVIQIEYQEYTDIVYDVKNNGVYSVFAYFNDNEKYLDLTSYINIETSYDIFGEPIIPLN